MDKWPTAKRLTKAELSQLREDAEARQEMSRSALAEYEAMVERHGAAGVAATDAVYQAAIDGYNRAKAAGDLAAEAKFLSEIGRQADRMVGNMEKVQTRRDRREAGEKLVAGAAPVSIVMEPVKVGDAE